MGGRVKGLAAWAASKAVFGTPTGIAFGDPEDRLRRGGAEERRKNRSREGAKTRRRKKDSRRGAETQRFRICG